MSGPALHSDLRATLRFAIYAYCCAGFVVIAFVVLVIITMPLRAETYALVLQTTDGTRATIRTDDAGSMLSRQGCTDRIALEKAKMRAITGSPVISAVCKEEP